MGYFSYLQPIFYNVLRPQIFTTAALKSTWFYCPVHLLSQMFCPTKPQLLILNIIAHRCAKDNYVIQFVDIVTLCLSSSAASCISICLIPITKRVFGVFSGLAGAAVSSIPRAARGGWERMLICVRWCSASSCFTAGNRVCVCGGGWRGLLGQGDEWAQKEVV